MSSYQISFYVTSQYGWQITILVDVVVSQFHLTTKMKNTTLYHASSFIIHAVHR